MDKNFPWTIVNLDNSEKSIIHENPKTQTVDFTSILNQLEMETDQNLIEDNDH